MTPNKKQKILIHIEQQAQKLDLQVKTLTKMLENLDTVKHYKNIDKRFLSKLMEGTPTDEQGHPQMYLTKRDEYYNFHDLTLIGRLCYRIERPATDFEKSYEPDKVQNELFYLDIGFTLYLSGDKGLFYSPEDDQITRLEKTLVGVIDLKTKEYGDILAVIDQLDDQLNKVKQYSQMLKQAHELKKTINYYIKDGIAKTLHDKTLDLYLENSLDLDLEK